MKYRLPQDVGLPSSGNRRGVPDFKLFTEDVVTYQRRYAEAMKTNNFEQRAHACWGLVTCGNQALQWVRTGLLSQDDDYASDAAGVLIWIGVPQTWIPELKKLADRLADSERLDALLMTLPPDLDNLVSDVPKTGDRLFDGELDAFTSDITFTNCSFESAVAVLKSQSKLASSCTHIHGNLRECLAYLEPWSMPSWKLLFIQTRNGTAGFSQGGGTSLHGVARALRCWSIETGHAPHIQKDGRIIRYGYTSMDVLDATGEVPLNRSIQVSFQSRWEWDESGEIMSFEDAEEYQSKKIKDRFGIEMLNRYCQSFGIERNDPGFYGTSAVLIEQDLSRWAALPTNKKSASAWLADHS
jgi:hypothetical protein